MKLTPNNTRAGSLSSTDVTSLNRRQFLTRTAGLTGTAALFSARGTRSSAATAGSTAEGPEMPNVKIALIVLTDCSPFVIAEEKGFF